MRFLAQDVLRRHGDARGLLGGRGDRLIVGVGVKRLKSAHNPGHRLHRDAGDVVQRLLFGEIDAGGLAVEFEPPRARILGAEALARQPRPDAPPGAEFRDFLEETDRDVEEKGKAPQHDVDVHAAIDAILRVLQGRGDGEGHGLDRRRAGLLHVLTDHRHGIPARHMPAAEFDVVEQHPPRAGQR